jgi:hypothetical protein
MARVKFKFGNASNDDAFISFGTNHNIFLMDSQSDINKECELSNVDLKNEGGRLKLPVNVAIKGTEDLVNIEITVITNGISKKLNIAPKRVGGTGYVFWNYNYTIPN